MNMPAWTRPEILFQDFRYALRTLRKSPGFAATAVLTLALGIGASTAVFTVVDSVVLKPLAYRDRGNLVIAWERVQAISPDPLGPNARHVDLWKKRATVFSGLSQVSQGASGLALGPDHPLLVGTVNSSPNLFDVLQVTPLLGRVFTREDGVKGHENVAILTYSLWQSVFHGDAEAVGKTVRLAGTPREIIGVLPPTFHFPNRNALRPFRSKQSSNNLPEPAIFLPEVLDLSQFSWNGDYGNRIVLARLNPGVSLGEAEAQLLSIQAQVIEEMPAGQRFPRKDMLSASVQPMQEAVVGESKAGLWLLMAAVAGLLLIACVNLANTHLGRALSRHREAAVRSALGAPKWRLLWSSLAESLLLAAIGGAAGIALAAAGLRLFRLYSPVDLPRLSEVHLNGTVLFFSVSITLGSSVLFGILPALKLFRTDPQSALQQSSNRAMGSRQSHRLRVLLIGLQVFGCTVLLLITGLFSRSLLHLLHQDMGFDASRVVIAAVDLPRSAYSAPASRVAFNDAVLQNLQSIPGVQSVGMVSAMPLEGESWIEGLQRLDRPNQESPLFNLRWVSPGYFETMRERLVGGRFFEENDRNLSCIILSEGLAKAVWQNANPIGAQVRVEGRTFTVIGIVADSRSTSLKSVPAKMAYAHYKDRPPTAPYFVARGLQPTGTMASAMREAVWKYAPAVTIARVKAMDSQVTDSLSTERFQTFVLLSFGAAALLLAMLGIYGVLTYSVATRKQEIGVRMALGASRLKIYELTMGEAGTPVLAGLGAGLVAGILGGKAIQSLLYGVQAMDPAVIIAVAILFASAAMLAAFVPARRAASVDPMEALRSE
jgi:putative ABC transport system permease protein